jgi:hypothetical protein
MAKRVERKGIQNGWPEKDLDPCFSYARVITAIECHLRSAVRHVLRGDAASANIDLVLANQGAREMASILPATKRHSETIVKETDALVGKLKSGKEIPKKHREPMVSKISALNPSVRDLFVRGATACRIDKS